MSLMSQQPPTVHISGFLASQISNTLLTTGQIGDPEGLLYGKVLVNTTKNMYDNSNDGGSSLRQSLQIHITGFKLSSNTASTAFHDSEGNVDWSKIMDCHAAKQKKRDLEDIVGILKCRQGVPLNPTLRDRHMLRSFTDLCTSSLRNLGNRGLEDVPDFYSLGFPFLLGLFTASFDSHNLLVQDMGFFHVPSPHSLPVISSSPANSNPFGRPLKSCKVKILNIAPLVEQSVELVYPPVDDVEEKELLQDQRRLWIRLHNHIWNDIAAARPN